MKRSDRHRNCAGFGAVILAFSLGASGDWWQFRGRDGSGAVPDATLPSALDRREHTAWEVPLPGRGLSSPILVGSRIFLTCASGPRQDRLQVLCLDARDGSRRWEREFFATGRTMCHEKTCVAANTPATDGTRVFALFSSNDLVALDLDGNLLWVRALTLDYPNVSNALGMSSSLVVVDDTVIAQVENDSQPLALGLDAATGLNRWKLERPKLANWTSPVVFKDRQAGGALVCLQSGRGLLAVEPTTGRTIWNYSDGAATIPSTTVGDGVLFVPSFGITAVRPGSGAAPERLWRVANLRPEMASPLVLGDRLYVVNSAGVLTCASTESGQRLWQLRLKGPISASPVADRTRLFIASESGLLQVVDTTAPEGKLAGELDFEETLLSTPAISGNALYLRSDHHLWKLGGS